MIRGNLIYLYHWQSRAREEKKRGCTGCVRQNENPTDFKIVKEPLLVQKQMLHQQKALDLCYLEPERQVFSLRNVSQRSNRRQEVKNQKRGLKFNKICFRAKRAWHPLDNATPLSFQLQIAEIMSFPLMYCLFLYFKWFFQNIEKGWRKNLAIKLFPQFLKMTKIKNIFLQPFSRF